MNTMTKDDLQQLKDLFNDSKEDAILFAKSRLQVRSKKKRIRRKVRKKIITQLAQMEDSIHFKKGSAKVKRTEINFSSLPITFILDLGREYFTNLDVVKSYYTKTKEEYYKNKDLLFDEMDQAISEASDSVRTEILQKIEERQK